MRNYTMASRGVLRVGFTELNLFYDPVIGIKINTQSDNPSDQKCWLFLFIYQTENKKVAILLYGFWILKEFLVYQRRI